MVSDSPSPHSPSLRLGLTIPKPSRRHHAQSLLGPSFHDPRTPFVLESHPEQAAPLSRRDYERRQAAGSHSALVLRLYLAACNPSSSCRFWVVDHLCFNLTCAVTSVCTAVGLLISSYKNMPKNKWMCVCVCAYMCVCVCVKIYHPFSSNCKSNRTLTVFAAVSTTDTTPRRPFVWTTQEPIEESTETVQSEVISTCIPAASTRWGTTGCTHAAPTVMSISHVHNIRWTQIELWTREISAASQNFFLSVLMLLVKTDKTRQQYCRLEIRCTIHYFFAIAR